MKIAIKRMLFIVYLLTLCINQNYGEASITVYTPGEVRPAVNPKLVTSFSDGVAIVKSYYYKELPEVDGVKPLISLTLEKQRFDNIIGRDQYLFLHVVVEDCEIMVNPPLISKKHQPYIMLKTIHGDDKIVFSNHDILNFGPKSISYWIGLKSLDKLFEAEKVYVMIYTENGNYLRWKLPGSVIEQWQIVVKTNLRKMRKEIENR